MFDSPSIDGIFGKEWCSSLWDKREPRAEEKPKEVEPDVPDEVNVAQMCSSHFQLLF